MQKPLIHLGGTSGADLALGYFKAMHLAKLLVQQLQECSPNGRDYYPQEIGTYGLALEENHRRLVEAKHIQKQAEELALHCQGNLSDEEQAKMWKEFQDFKNQ